MVYRLFSPPEGIWFKASYSNGCGACVEVRYDGNMVSVRDSKYRLDADRDLASEPIISLTSTAWRAFLHAVAESNSSEANGGLWTESDAEGNTTLHSNSGVSFHFTSLEWTTFFLGVRGRQFDPAKSLALA